MEFEQVNKTIIIYRSSANMAVLTLQYADRNVTGEAVTENLLKSRFIKWMESDEEKIHGPFEVDSISASDFKLLSFEEMLQNIIEFIRESIFENTTDNIGLRFLEDVLLELVKIKSKENECYAFMYEFDRSTFNETNLSKSHIKLSGFYPFTIYKSNIVINQAAKTAYLIEIADD